jgi:UDP-glucose 4-epimerase
MPIAIIGGRGYIGQALYADCLSKNIPAWIVGRQSAIEVSAVGFQPPYRSSKPDLVQAIAGASVVVHLATVSTPALSEKNLLLDIENITFTLSLIEACHQARTKHIVFLSSGGTVYGEAHEPLSETSPTHPICSYGIAKLACENYLRRAAQEGTLDVTVLRCSNVYGGNQVKKGDQGVISYLREAISYDLDVTLLGDTQRDYLYIEDVLSAFHRVIETPSGFRLFNISTGVGTSLANLAELIAKRMNKKAKIKMGERRTFDLAYNVLLNHKAKKELGWSPATSLEKGLAAYLSA